MRPVLAAAVAVAAFAAVGGAQAKVGPLGLELCGASACHHVAMADGERVFVGSTTGAGAPAGPAPFYEVRWGGTNQHFFYWIPSAHRARFSETSTAGSWYRPSDTAEAILRSTAEGLEPFQLTPVRVTVGGRVVRQPETYVRLFHGRFTNVPAAPWLRVKITTDVPTPWSDDAVDLDLARNRSYVYFDGWTLRIPKAVAKRARLGLPLR